ncbi:MAG: hypothetical protein ACRD9R_00530 [Pyrinomonadaceae bacterium]
MTETTDPRPLLLLWRNLRADLRRDLAGRLAGLYGAPADDAAFDALSVDKQQALFQIYWRMARLGLWPVVERVENVYGVGGVGMSFAAWPFILSTLKRRKDFTRLFANHCDTTGGFYERGRVAAVLHFLYVDKKNGGAHRSWAVHFDLHSPVYSPASAFRHLRVEAIGKLTPDWRMIGAALASDAFDFTTTLA